MIYRIVKAKPIKNNVVRLYIEELEIDENGAVNLSGEYELAVDAGLLPRDGHEEDMDGFINYIRAELTKQLWLTDKCKQLEGLDWSIDYTTINYTSPEFTIPGYKKAHSVDICNLHACTLKECYYCKGMK